MRRAADGSRIDIKELRALALTPHGFVSSELRRKVWPKLLGLSTDVKMPHYGILTRKHGKLSVLVIRLTHHLSHR